MTIKRRELLQGIGGLYAWASWAAPALPMLTASCGDGSEESSPQFLHGVASGDPRADAVILWTRVTPPDGVDSLEVSWELAVDSGFTQLVTSGLVTTDATRDFTVKVDANGLSPRAVYYYRFRADTVDSPIGRTQTAASGETARLRFAVVSCSSLAHGYFHAYRSVSGQLDLDAVIHLGDYIYEYGTGEYGDVRTYEPAHEIVSLSDYRQRYAQYRRDPDLQEVHRQLPFICVWDDHEFANNTYTDGAENHQPELGEGDFAQRKAAAAQAYDEWMPIRMSQIETPQGVRYRIFRSFQYGDLVDLIMLDTRAWGRQKQLSDAADPALLDAERTLLGHDQEAWLAEQLSASTARFRLLGQQVTVGRIPIEANLDAWFGYPAARARLLDQLRNAPADCVILSGDVHSSWAMDVIDDAASDYDLTTGSGAVAAEFVTPGVTSPYLPRDLAEEYLPDALAAPYVKYAQMWHRGYMLLDVDHTRVQAAWYHYEAVEQPTPPASSDPVLDQVAAAYAGEHRVRLQDAPAASSTPIAGPAPH